MTHDLDPNHIIDEDYSPSQFERMDQICTQRLNSPDFGQPKPIGQGYIIIGGMVVMTVLAFLYSCQPAVAVIQ